MERLPTVIIAQSPAAAEATTTSSRGAGAVRRLGAAALMAALVACGSAGGSGSFGAYPGGALGTACTLEGQAGCSFDGGHAITERCVGGAWALQQACASGETCTIDGSGQAGCAASVAIADVAQADGSGVDVVGDSGSSSDAGGGDAGGGDTGGDGATSGGDATVADSGGPGPLPPPALVGVGAFVAAIDGIQVQIDYAGVAAGAQLVHRQSPAGDGGCVSKAELTLARPDGSCRLVLSFAVGAAGKPLNLTKAQFVARDVALPGAPPPPPCANWPDEPASGMVVYEAVSPQATVALGPIAQPAAAAAFAELAGQVVTIVAAKPLQMKAGQRQFALQLTGLGVAGKLTSVGDPGASCGITGKPLPQWQLADIGKGSPGYGNTYGLDAFAGKKVVVALVSDWCNSCRAQTQLMQQLQDEAVAAGHNDVQLVLIADKQKSDPSQLTKLVKTIPIFQDTAAVNAWSIMNASHVGKFQGSAIRNSGYGYSKAGEEIMYFAPNGSGSLNLTAFKSAVMKVINAKDP